MKYINFLAVIFIVFTSCNRQEKTSGNIQENLEFQEDVFVNKIGVSLSAEAKKDLEFWEDYQLIDARIKPYFNINKSQALQNAEELAALILDASDTITVEELDRPDIKIRFNVMYNHAFRLQDMNSITSISEDEVKEEVYRLLEAYSALNDKINVVYKINKYKETYDKYKADTLEFVIPDELDDEEILEKPENNRQRFIKRTGNLKDKS